MFLVTVHMLAQNDPGHPSHRELFEKYMLAKQGLTKLLPLYLADHFTLMVNEFLPVGNCFVVSVTSHEGITLGVDED